ncbi:DUF6879 family protein [Streptomyces incarnatus]|nr:MULTISPECIES: DUF6879 family protein [Streptomyces]
MPRFHSSSACGELTPDDEEFTDDPAVVGLCADAFDAVWPLAVPHADYRLS